MKRQRVGRIGTPTARSGANSPPISVLARINRHKALHPSPGLPPSPGDSVHSTSR